MNKKEKKNKRAMTQLKAYFLIINVVLAIVAFGSMVSAYYGEVVETVKGVEIINEGSSGFSVNGVIFEKLNEAKKAAETAAIVKPSPSTSLSPVSGVVNILESQVYTAATPFTATVGGTQLIGITKIEKVGDVYKITSSEGTRQIDSTAAESLIEKQKMGLTSSTAPTKITSVGGEAIISNALQIGMMFGIGYLIGGFIGGNADIALGTAMAATTAIYQVGSGMWGSAYKGVFGAYPGLISLGVGAAVFILMYKDTSQEVVEFNCLPYQPPIGGADCEKCNSFEQCSEYSCKSLGQACQLLNAGTEQESCDWVNPNDVNSPKIKISEVLKGYKWVPDTAVRPPATGVVISQENGNCVKAFTPLEFTIASDEPSQCKIDYNLTKGFDEMSYYIGGSNLFSYNHTEKMSLPSPSAVNAIAPELKNDGTYTLYVRCKDANGNFNQDAYSVRFCVEKGPDTTPPKIQSLSIPSNSPVSYNTTNLSLEVYVNEPAECKWSREDRDFAQMENNMSCKTNLWEINNNNVYTCKTTLTGIKNKQDNEYYFRCKDQPKTPESQRNANTQSSLYNIIGTQPLNILYIKPSNETIKDSTDTISIDLEVKTDNGYKNGGAFCYYTDTQTTDTKITNKTCIGEEDTYLLFAETGITNRETTEINIHKQNQRLTTGDYTYYVKCVDLGGNAAYACTKFSVEVDRSAPIVVRAYKESEQLKIITDDKADCSYSYKDCNFEIKDGIKMSTLDNEAHTAEWLITKNYYIRCSDKYNNQPNPNTCSAVIRPYKFVDKNDGVVSGNYFVLS